MPTPTPLAARQSRAAAMDDAALALEVRYWTLVLDKPVARPEWGRYAWLRACEAEAAARNIPTWLPRAIEARQVGRAA